MIEKKVYEKPFAEVVDVETENLLAAFSSLNPDAGEGPLVDVEEGNPDPDEEEWLPFGMKKPKSLW